MLKWFAASQCLWLSTASHRFACVLLQNMLIIVFLQKNTVLYFKFYLKFIKYLHLLKDRLRSIFAHIGIRLLCHGHLSSKVPLSDKCVSPAQFDRKIRSPNYSFRRGRLWWPWLPSFSHSRYISWSMYDPYLIEAEYGVWMLLILDGLIWIQKIAVNHPT